MSDLTPTRRLRVKRLHQRGAYDFDTIAVILDSGLLCHVGYEDDNGWLVWGGVVPVQAVMRPPLPDERLVGAKAPPAYLADLSHLGLKAK